MKEAKKEKTWTARSIYRYHLKAHSTDQEKQRGGLNQMEANLRDLIARVTTCDPSIEVIFKPNSWVEVRTPTKLFCCVLSNQLETYLTGLCHGLEHARTLP